MSAANNVNFVGLFECCSVKNILQTRQQGKPFLSSTLEAYLDVGDFEEFKHTVTGKETQIELIFDVALHDPSEGLLYSFLEERKENTH